MEIKVVTLPHFDSHFSLPSYETPGAAGADVKASLMDPNSPIYLEPGQRGLISTGLSVEIPVGFELQVRPRSGLSLKTGLMVVNSPGTIDSDYRGEIKIILGNLGKQVEVIHHGDRVAQLVLMPVLQAKFKKVNGELLSETSRGEGGFGSTGKN